MQIKLELTYPDGTTRRLDTGHKWDIYVLTVIESGSPVLVTIDIKHAHEMKAKLEKELGPMTLRSVYGLSIEDLVKHDEHNRTGS